MNFDLKNMMLRPFWTPLGSRWVHEGCWSVIHDYNGRMRIYLAHSVRQSEVPVLWELQASAAGHGIQIVIPRYRPVRAMTASRRSDLQRCDAVIAVATEPAEHFIADIRYAASKRKPVVAFVSEGIGLPAGVSKIVLRPGMTAADLLAEVAKRLPHPRKESEANRTLGVLAALGGLLLFLHVLSDGGDAHASSRR